MPDSIYVYKYRTQNNVYLQCNICVTKEHQQIRLLVLFSTFVIFLYGLSTSPLSSYLWLHKETWEPLNHCLNQWRWLDQWTGTHWVITPPTCSAPDVTLSHPESAHIPFVTAIFSWNKGIRLNGSTWKYDFQYALLTHWGAAFAKFYQSVQLCIKWLSKDQLSLFGNMWAWETKYECRTGRRTTLDSQIFLNA